MLALLNADNTSAGINFDGGYVQDATLIVDSVVYNVTFQQGGWNTVSGDIDIAGVVPWWSDPLTANGLATALASELDQSTSGVNVDALYLFSYTDTSPSQNTNAVSLFDADPTPGSWKAYPEVTFFDAHSSDRGNTFYYAKFVSSNSVPEPSTAAAMGVLVLAGIIRNRRRKSSDV